MQADQTPIKYPIASPFCARAKPGGQTKTSRDKIQRAAASPKTGQQRPAEQARNFCALPPRDYSIDRQPKGTELFQKLTQMSGTERSPPSC
jgi:hypothetical protein